MTEATGNTAEKPTYILTLDLGEKLEAFRRVGIDAPGPHDDFTDDLQREIVGTIQSALPDVDVRKVYMADLADSVLGASSKVAARLKDPLVVSSCPEIAVPANGQKLEINRLINIRGEHIGLGPRPGNPSIAEQTQKIRQVAINRDIVIVEDGIFTGSTVKYITEEFKGAGMAVRAVVTGFNCDSRDTSWFTDNDVELVVAQPFDKIHDWVPDHDFVPFVPGNGKVLGVNLGGKNNYPYYDHNRATYSVPYIRPFGPTEAWASIPEAAANKASFELTNIAMTLFKEIERRNPGQDLRIGDLVDTQQRTSIPISIGAEHFPDLKSTVSEYLRDCL